MATTNTPIFPQNLQNYGVQILPADTSTKKLLAAGGTNGTKIEFISASSTDTSARDLNIYLYDGTTYHLMYTISIVINAGNTNAIAAVNILNNSMSPAIPYDSNGNKYIYLKSGWSLYVATSTTVTAAKIVDIIAQGEDF
jgi:hypothetical protein